MCINVHAKIVLFIVSFIVAVLEKTQALKLFLILKFKLEMRVVKQGKITKLVWFLGCIMVKYCKTTLKSLLYSDQYPDTFKNTSDYESKMVYEGLHVDLNYNLICNINFK